MRLSAAYATLRRHGCRIAFSGGELRIYLPLAAASSRVQTAETAEAGPAAESPRDILLLADDDTAARSATAEVLREEGYGVLEASDGEEAIDTFTENKEIVKLVLLDMDMPKKNGKEVYEFLRKAHPGVRVLFITGRGKEAIVGRAAKDGQVGFVQKPVSPAVLISRIRELLE